VPVVLHASDKKGSEISYPTPKSFVGQNSSSTSKSLAAALGISQRLALRTT
jgi:hypothetical protein